jgi:hypothetical protein
MDMIGGIDIVLVAPREVPLADVIVRRMAETWSDGLFEDVDADRSYPLADPSLAIHAGRSKEFFVYRDRAAEKSWEEDGAVPENENTMIHFLIGGRLAGKHGLRQMTIVCDQETDEVKQLVSDLKNIFRAWQVPARVA